ncbi:unnamed protein product [Owenia fusiformis]|uniref:Uncharacterized protein n=1 Tax=Owenia fusiformis TaxID=6347 RepID=A0A8J1UKW3_OWEFU|nr:unnamed protein product [Owenia fusiformis]
MNNLHAVASQAMYEIRFELTTWEGDTRNAYYSIFDVTDVHWGLPRYKLRLDHYRGNAGDFKSYDSGNKFKCGWRTEHHFWWFGNWKNTSHKYIDKKIECAKANLFGRYNNGPKCDIEMECMTWPAWPDQGNKYYSFKKMRIMIRPLRSIPPCIDGLSKDTGDNTIVKCEGAWLVVAHKIDGNVHFNRTVAEYIDGFESTSGEFFTGLRPLYELTERFRWYTVRFEATTIDGKVPYVEYSAIRIRETHYFYYMQVKDFPYHDDVDWQRLDCSNPWFRSLFATWGHETKCIFSIWYCGCMLQTSPNLFDYSTTSSYRDIKMKIKLHPLPCIEHTQGVNTIQLQNGDTFEAKCDDQWLVVAHRFDGSEDFYRPMADYEAGFGSPKGEYFIGLDNLISLLKHNWYVFRLEFTTWAGDTEFAEYYVFFVGEFKFRLEDFRGSSLDLISTEYEYAYEMELPDYGFYEEVLKGYQFGTRDNSKCGSLRRGAWWYGFAHYGSNHEWLCGNANPFGVYRNGPKCDIRLGCMGWMGWPGELFNISERQKNKELDNGWYSFKEMRLLIRLREPRWS